jgi:hypothetical protein
MLKLKFIKYYKLIARVILYFCFLLLLSKILKRMEISPEDFRKHGILIIFGTFGIQQFINRIFRRLIAFAVYIGFFHSLKAMGVLRLSSKICIIVFSINALIIFISLLLRYSVQEINIKSVREYIILFCICVNFTICIFDILFFAIYLIKLFISEIKNRCSKKNGA